MRNLLQRLGAALVRNPAYKLLSLSVALMAWLYVQGEQVVETKVRARVMWELPPELLTVEPLPASVALTIGGPRNATRKAAHYDVRIPIDLSEIGMGEHSLDFSAFPVAGLPPNVQVLGVSPSTVRFVLDEVSAKKVRVEPRLVGDPAAGWDVVGAEVEPQVVSIRGPRAVVDGVGEVATMPVDVSGMERDTEQRVDIDLPRSTQLVSDEPIRVRVDVEPEVVRREFTSVPVGVWRQDGWNTEPDTVRVVLEGPAAAMGTLAPEDVAVFAHLPDNPTRSAYEASFGPDSGLRLRVLHTAGEALRVVTVEPTTVRVERP